MKFKRKVLIKTGHYIRVSTVSIIFDFQHRIIPLPKKECYDTLKCQIDGGS